ncbi:ORF6C domain-containing protein [Paenibacillus sp. 11B]|uniref:ORF6C domain-containing protein n=1 Tax=unclassified Paenibacillus TaxID=185978 RepID=UPI0026556499|nr:ORF6C domain-containing protein [Paenibacillus sp. 11B]MDN8590969.1 ORF6C domain-containing protein [Paenibacillus sp. 11B]
MQLSNVIVPLEQKMVEFNGSEILGVKASDGKVYVGARWVCDGIGLREGQRNNQLSKIQSDLVLKQGVRKFILPTNSGDQEVTVVEIDFLPLWIAKISPNTVEGEVQGNLINYQLKAKDVLAAAFLPPTFNLDSLSPEMKAAFLLDVKVQKLDTRIEHLENNTTIDHGQLLTLQTAANKVVTDLLGGRDTGAYQNNGLRSRVYKALWRDYKGYFNINSYHNTLIKSFDRALEHIESWKLPGQLQREIEESNRQMAF